MTLPVPLRNRLAGLILDALHDRGAREALGAVAGISAGPPPALAALPPGWPGDLLEATASGLRLRREWSGHAGEVSERARRAHRVVESRALEPAGAPLADAVETAGALFDARLFFEVHELLEPHWMRAAGPEREALQGLIQVAAALHHLASGNAAGACSLLHDGAAKLLGQTLAGRSLDPFARALTRCLGRVLALGPDAVAGFDWAAVPRFPAAAAGAQG